MLSKFLSPKNDFAFKKIFGTEKNKDILIHFLNDVLTFKGGGHIQDVTFLKTFQDPEIAAQKTSIVDILCKDQKENSYIVEMQVAKEKGFEKRAQYYASKAYISQANAGGAYHHFKEVIFLAISDFVMFPKKKGYKSDHIILDKESHENDLKDFSFTFIELPKFKKNINQLSNMIEKWCYFFKHAGGTSEKDLKKLVGHDQIIERAYEELDRYSWNPQELLTYDQAEKYTNTYYASLGQKFDEGKIEGRVEGKIEGKIEGKVEGKIEGKIEIAENMLKHGLELQTIKALTGLSTEEIKALKQNL
jgi:predicted transposase/invertase (TIGR01784 family)